MDDRLIIVDTTLRDGEQAPGIALTPDEKVIIAHQLAKLKVDVLEAGFAASSPGDFDAVSKIAEGVKGPVIASLARAHPRVASCRNPVARRPVDRLFTGRLFGHTLPRL